MLPALFYFSAGVFLVGMGWRVSTWLRAPVPLKIVLTPGPVTAGDVVRRLAGEALLFRSLLGADRWLWAAGWLFHLSLVLLVLGHVGGLAVPGFARAVLGLSEEKFHTLANMAGGFFGVLAVIALAVLFLRRLANERLRYLSTLNDYLAVVLLLLVLGSGNHMRFLGGVDLAQAQEFVTGLLMFHPVAAPASPIFAWHLLLVCALLVYIPFSKLVHLGGLVFSPALNQKNNPRETRYA